MSLLIYVTTDMHSHRNAIALYFFPTILKLLCTSATHGFDKDLPVPSDLLSSVIKIKGPIFEK